MIPALPSLHAQVHCPFLDKPLSACAFVSLLLSYPTAVPLEAYHARFANIMILVSGVHLLTALHVQVGNWQGVLTGP